MTQNTMQENDLDLFCRVVDGKIVEYPVYRLHIRNRAHPLSFYTPVLKTEAPEADRFGTVSESLELRDDGKVYIVYTKRSLSLEEILNSFQVRNDTDPTAKPSTKPVSEIDADLLKHAFTLMDNLLDDKLEELAKSRQYKSLDRLFSYLDSSIVSCAGEAKHVLQLRDMAWSNLSSYFNAVQSGATPVPGSVSEVISFLPPITWPA